MTMPSMIAKVVLLVASVRPSVMTMTAVVPGRTGRSALIPLARPDESGGKGPTMGVP